MALYKMTFDTYEVISSCNLHLNDDSMPEAIGMGSIVVGVKIRCKTTRSCITNVLLVPKLQANLFSVSKLLLKGLKVAISRRGMHCKRHEHRCGCNSSI